MKRLLRYICLLLFVAVAVEASAEKKPVMQKVYMFGFASSFTDSLAYLTEVQELDSVYVMPNGFLADRPLYSLQLYGFVNEQRGVAYPTAAVFFDVKSKKLAKRYQKVKRMYQDNPNLKLVVLTREEFGFRPEEYMESIVMEADGENGAGDTPEKEESAVGKKKTKKQKKDRKGGGQ